MRRNNLFNFSLLFLSVILFVFSQPSLLFEDGLSFLAWFAYIPYFLLIDRLSLAKALLFGFIYGFISYCCLCWWLSSFGLTALLFVCFLFAIYNSFIFFLISWSKKIFSNKFSSLFWLFRVLIIVCFEFIRSHGVFAFSYGIIAYSQWKNPVFLRLSSFVGVYGLSFIIILFNSILEKILSERNLRKNFNHLSVCIAILLSINVYYIFSTLFSQKDTVDNIKIALVQNSSSADSSCLYDYCQDSLLLQKLSVDALTDHNDIEIIVWPETAIVPDILYNLKNTSSIERNELAKSLCKFFSDKQSSFLIGNNHADERGIHNSALFFQSDVSDVQVYNKNKLVPFTEFWPDSLDFEIFENIKKSLGCDYFVKGEKINIFELNSIKHSGIKFGVPICFEDSFPYIIRKMKNSGADFFVNISNDAWAGCIAAQNMHLSMDTFRCAEFKTPMVRSTIDGVTCSINSQGKIISSIEPKINGYLYTDVEISSGYKSIYCLTGDILYYILCFFVLIVLLILSFLFVKVSMYGRR